MSDKKLINYFCVWNYYCIWNSLANEMRTNKNCIKNLKGYGKCTYKSTLMQYVVIDFHIFEYWKGITKDNQPSLIGYLKYRKTKVEHLIKENELSRFFQDINCLKHHYNNGRGLNTKIIKHIEGNFEVCASLTAVLESYIDYYTILCKRTCMITVLNLRKRTCMVTVLNLRKRTCMVTVLNLRKRTCMVTVLNLRKRTCMVTV